MDEFFKGYIETRDKQAIEKFKNRNDFKTYTEMGSYSEFAGVLNDNTILIDIDDKEQSEILLNIIDELGIKCLVIETSRGKHFYFNKTCLWINCRYKGWHKK